MLSCLKPLAPPSSNTYFSSPASQGYSVDNTPTSSVQVSPTVNLSREYTFALQTSSFAEIRTTFDQDDSIDQNVVIENVDFLRPSRECVQEALSFIPPNNSLTHLFSTYLEHSEHTSRLCFLIYRSTRRARLLYTPIHNLLEDLPRDSNSDSYSLSHSQSHLAHDAFLLFDHLENPFLSPDSQDFNDIRHCFSQLRQNLDRHLKKSKSRVNMIRRFSTCLAMLPSNITIKETVHLAQLDAVAKGTYVLYNDLDTIDRLVAHLHSVVENDKLLIHLGLERDVDRYTIQEILKQLRRNRSSFEQRLVDLQEHLILFSIAINQARSMLLQEIHLHRNPG